VVFVNEKGHVIYGQRYNGTFTVPLNLQDFPFDRHTLSINATSFYAPDELQLIIDETLTGWARRLTIPDWIVEKAEAKINTFKSRGQKRNLSQLEFSFEIHRRLGFYIWKVILPLSLIVIMSWGVFWIDPQRLEAQIALSATAFLTIFAYQFAITTHLPRIAYLTRMDRFTMLCSLLVLAALIEAVTKSFYVKKKQLQKARRVDHFSRFFFPVAFLAVTLYSFWL